jgi:flagellar hook-associated protein 3 FlgL
MQAQVRQQEATTQVSSQKNASDLKGYARQAETLLATRSVQTKVEGYLAQGDVLTSKLEAQDQALTQVADSVQSARQAIAEAIATGRGEALMGEVSAWFSAATDSLNARFGGRYLFSGGQVDTPATSASQITDLTAAPAIATAVIPSVAAVEAPVPASRAAVAARGNATTVRGDELKALGLTATRLSCPLAADATFATDA